MKWNASSKVWEVSLRLHPQDLEAAIEKEIANGRLSTSKTKKVSIDDADFSEKVIEYLSTRFFVRRTPWAMNVKELRAIVKAAPTNRFESSTVSKSNDQPTPIDAQSSLRWVGMESEKGWLWIHLEMQVPVVEQRKQRLWMVNSILMDHVEKQENSVSIDPIVAPKYALQFKLGEELQAMK